MKRALLLLGAACALMAQTAKFPGAVATDADLYAKRNRVQTTLSVAMTTGDTVAVVADASQFPQWSLATIDDSKGITEIVLVCGVSGNFLTIGNASGCPSTAGRGQDGTAAIAHKRGAAVSLFDDAAHHERMKAEVIALENALGPNLSHVLNAGPAINAAAMTFPPQSPGGSLIAGNTPITMAPVPNGVNGTDIGHYLYVSGGAGAAEACLITGGAGAAGQSSGQIILQCGHTHSGGFQVSTATAGIAEAVSAAISSGVLDVQLSAGTYAVFAAIQIPAPMRISGAGFATTVIVAQNLAADVFYVTASTLAVSDQTIIRDMMITAATYKTAGTAVRIEGGAPYSGFILLSGMWFDHQYQSITTHNSCYYRFTDSEFHDSAPGVTMVTLTNDNNDCGDGKLDNNGFFGNGADTAIHYVTGGGLRIQNNKILGLATGVDGTSSGGPFEVVISGNTFDNNKTDGILWHASPGAIMADVVISGNYFGASPTNSLIRWEQDATATNVRGTISGNVFTLFDNNGTALRLLGGSGLTVTGNTIYATGNSSQKGLEIGAAFVGGIVTGNSFYTFSNAGFLVSASTKVLITNNVGIDDVIPAVNSAATLTMPVNPNVTIQGSATVTAVVPPTGAPGQHGRLMTAGIVAFSAGTSIGNSCTTAPNKLYQWYYDGTKFWISGGGC